ncbi:MAG: hypothetical protein PHN47_00410 [Clostridia bacterium]|jgi:hypothetical protein|nr:hypothetical protein [Clostridia bacterium]MDD4570942.1 hypothetical protein [Clostridia bacterium]
MNPCELITIVSSLAITIANNVPDDDDLSMLASIVTQLGDTLATIANQRSLQK